MWFEMVVRRLDERKMKSNILTFLFSSPFGERFNSLRRRILLSKERGY